jgi:predicted amidophosphoribosyltransferase
MANQNEVTRLCPNCRRKLYRSDELRGRCKCGQHLVSLSGRWGAWDNDTTESIEALSPGAGDARTNEEKDAGDRLDWIEWLHGTPDEPACPNCGAPLVNGECRWCSAADALVEVFADPGGQYLGAVLADPARLPFKRFAGTFWYRAVS